MFYQMLPTKFHLIQHLFNHLHKQHNLFIIININNNNNNNNSNNLVKIVMLVSILKQMK